MPLLALEPFIQPDDLLVSPVDPATTNARWWVLHTRPRAEKTLARRFYERKLSFFLPLYLREWRNRGRRLRSHLPLFPGYVFLHGDLQHRLVALETNLVAFVLPVVDQAQLFADLQRVHQMIATGAAITPEERLEPGDPVTIVKGPLAGLEGKVLKRGKQLKFFVEVQMLQRAVSAEVESWMLEPSSQRDSEAMAPAAV
jgi:transcriptional antiterminator RfaH